MRFEQGHKNYNHVLCHECCFPVTTLLICGQPLVLHVRHAGNAACRHTEHTAAGSPGTHLSMFPPILCSSIMAHTFTSRFTLRTHVMISLVLLPAAGCARPAGSGTQHHAARRWHLPLNCMHPDGYIPGSCGTQCLVASLMLWQLPQGASLPWYACKPMSVQIAVCLSWLQSPAAPCQ
jgi:hypothetical protein